MRKRRTRKPVARPTRRRTTTRSAIGVTNPTDLMLVVGGSIAAKFVSDKLLTKLNDNIKSAALIGSYFLLPMISKGGRQKQMLQMLGAGMAVTGSLNLLKGFGIGSLDNDVLTVDIDRLETIGVNVLGAGDILAGDISTINGMDDISVINGCDDYSEVEDLD